MRMLVGCALDRRSWKRNSALGTQRWTACSEEQNGAEADWIVQGNQPQRLEDVRVVECAEIIARRSA